MQEYRKFWWLPVAFAVVFTAGILTNNFYHSHKINNTSQRMSYIIMSSTESIDSKKRMMLDMKRKVSPEVAKKCLKLAAKNVVVFYLGKPYTVDSLLQVAGSMYGVDPYMFAVNAILEQKQREDERVLVSSGKGGNIYGRPGQDYLEDEQRRYVRPTNPDNLNDPRYNVEPENRKTPEEEKEEKRQKSEERLQRDIENFSKGVDNFLKGFGK